MIDLVQGDVLEVLRQVPDNTFHAVLTDPPYGLSFMGKHWDYDVPSVEVWREVVRVLRPGGAVLSFGGTRTYHRLVCNAEDGGLEVRDQLCWLYAKGFPKSLNVSKALDKAAGAERPVIGVRPGHEEFVHRTDPHSAGSTSEGWARPWQKDPEKVLMHHMATGPATDQAKAWDGYGTALKPAHEPILLARKPLDGTVAENVTRWGCGALDIDGCRVGQEFKSGWSESGSKAGANLAMSGGNQEREAKPDASKRWPANLLLDEGAAEVLDQEVGPRDSNPFRANEADSPVNTTGKDKPAGGTKTRNQGPSRFFFSSKVSTRERNEGCDSLPLRTAGEVTDREDDTQGLDSPRAGAGRTGGARNHHPTLKPIGLAKYLAQLIRPPGDDALILIPFAGAGSEVIGATLAGWTGGLAIERDADYVHIARARLAYHLREGEE